MGFRFIHAADLHLDTPFQGVARVSEEVAALLRDASLDAFDRLVQAALDNEVVFILFVGDLYDGEQRGVRAQLRFLRGLETLAKNGIKAFIVHGNHDPLGGWSAIREWPPGVTIFGAEEVVGVPVELGGSRVATVFGLSFGRREVTDNLSLRFPRGAGRDPGEGLRIGLLHCSVGDQPEHSAYAPCSLPDLSAASIDYWALGHIHRAAVIKNGHPWVVYPGNTQGRSAKPAEMGAKGAMLVEVEGVDVRSVEFLPTDSVRFSTLEVDLSQLGGGCDLSGFRGELVRRALELHEEAPHLALLLRTELRGRGPLHADLALPGTRDDVLRDLRDTLGALSPPVWFEDLRDRTAPEIDLDVVRARDDFTSGLLARAEALCGDAQGLAQLRSALTPSAPADLLRRCGPPDEEEMRWLLEAATILAVEALETEVPSCG
jgi:DNA repair exonuclease SbcCD nuclease subunit